MVWVKSEYAGELAVLSTWLVGLAPWSVSTFSVSGLTVAAFRFLPFRVQYIFGGTVPGERPFLWMWEIGSFQQSTELVLAGQLGTAAFLVYLVPFWLSLYYYYEEERVAAVLPVDPVRLFAALLGLVGVLSLAASALFVRYFAGFTVPVGSILALVFAYLLATVDRT
ncbi:TIGR04206 family protein [Haloarcula halophila]|uniref:TIGR04206 family protein n=1 Tax=Haloarcula TaxID=2237 RepID=UPI0023E3C439|nr:TIGR04206 family protein [Halomicroarcula sp. DFY41]